MLEELIGVVLWFSSGRLGAVILGQIRAACCESGSIWVSWCGKTPRGVKLEEKPHGFIKGRHEQQLGVGEGLLVLGGEATDAGTQAVAAGCFPGLCLHLLSPQPDISSCHLRFQQQI